MKNKCAFCGKEYNENEIFVRSTTNLIGDLLDEIDDIASDELDFDEFENLRANFKNLFICEKCVEKAYSLINEIKKNKEAKNNENNFACEDLKPVNIYNKLGEYIIGQDEAKKTIATEIYNHYKRNKYNKESKNNNDAIKIEKSNILLVGPTGSGKTHIVRTIAKILDIPIAIEDVTGITARGFVGRDVDDVLRSLINEADGDLEKAQNGIIYLDEIDKINAASSNTESRSKDISGEEVQKEFLKMIENGIYRMSKNKESDVSIEFDTSNVLFIAGGAFDGIEKIIKKRVDGSSSNSVGFCSKPKSKNFNKNDFNEYIDKITVDDLKKYGMSREFLGRFAKIAPLHELTEEALIKILTEPKNAIFKQYEKIFELDNIKLTASDKALENIVKKTKKEQTGARALRSILESTLKAPLFEAPSDEKIKEVIINDDLSISYKKKRKKINKLEV